jgi:hypothetical protein
VKLQSPDLSRASFLLKETERSYEFVKIIVKKIGINDENANDVIKLCYDAIMELIRADMLVKGYNATGQGAHEAEVSYLRILGFKESEIQFADQLRYFRNGITYYGKILDKEYAENVISFMDKVYPELKRIVEKK